MKPKFNPGDRVVVTWLGAEGTVVRQAGRSGRGIFPHQRAWIVRLDNGSRDHRFDEAELVPMVRIPRPYASYLRLVVDNTTPDTLPSEVV